MPVPNRSPTTICWWNDPSAACSHQRGTFHLALGLLSCLNWVVWLWLVCLLHWCFFGWTFLTVVLGVAGGTDNISPLAFAVAVVGSAMRGGPISTLLCGVTSRVRLRCRLFLL